MMTRHVCAACRIRKCFLIGMSSDLIRKEILKSTKQPSSTQSAKTSKFKTIRVCTSS